MILDKVNFVALSLLYYYLVVFKVCGFIDMEAYKKNGHIHFWSSYQLCVLVMETCLS